MKTFRMKGNPEQLEFTNYDRLGEDVLLERVKAKLAQNPRVIIGPKKTGPSEDTYTCQIDGKPFTLIFDLNYGPSICAKNPEALSKLESYFNQ